MIASKGMIQLDSNLENEINPLILDESEQSSGAKIRQNFSMEEIQKLLVDIGAEVSSYKAEQIHTDPRNMVQTIRGGRIVWITVDEMNALLSKQKRIVSARQAQRSIRGDNSISNEILRRADACRSLISAVRKVSPDDSPEFTRSLRTLESLQNLSVCNAREVRVLEAAIQRKKQEDPLLQEMEKATEEMMAALKEDEQAEVDVCQSFCDRHMEEYLARQKRLEPYVRKAKEFRLPFLLGKQQLFLFQYELIEKGERVLSKHMDEILYYDKETIYSDRLVNHANEIRSIIEQSCLYFNKLASLSPKELEDQKDLFIHGDKEYITPLFNKMIEYTDLFSEAWKVIVEKKKEESTSVTAKNEAQNVKTVSRIARQEKIEKEEKSWHLPMSKKIKE